MTRWLDPAQLARTAWRVATARHADRARETMGGQAAPVARYGDDGDGGGGDVWFDFVADLGDAFDPTMAVAWHLGRRSVPLTGDEEGLFPTPPPSGLPRGRFLVLGGDEVYPYATARRYRDQTVGPYSLAFEGDGEGEGGADVYALPGNHDWYGKLGPFRSTFCEGGAVGAWTTRQSASWFAVQLPKGWWLWAIDTGIGGAVDPVQRAYFAEVAGQLQAGDRIVLCTPVPLWVLSDRHPQDLAVVEEFVREVVGGKAEVPLYLSGDAHVFAAYWRGGIGKELHVTSGGGGAFLHPTHHLLIDTRNPGQPEFHLIDAWPSRERSKALAQPSLRLMWDRQSRLLVPFFALLHLAYAALTTVRWLSPVERAGPSLPSSLAWVLSAPLAWPFLALIVAVGVVAVAPNTRTRLVKRGARRRGLVLGTLQALLFAAAAVAGRFMAERWGDGRADRAALVSLAALAGSVASLALFGWFLGRANRAVDVGDNAVFSAQHVDRYKHFVRCRVDGRTGRLDVFVVGIEDPGKGWAAAMAAPDRVAPTSCSSPVYLWGRTLSPTAASAREPG